MARLSREESQALTRERLLTAARELFFKEGYATTSVERIADAAGYSKGAVYSNFEGKDAILLEVLDSQGQQCLGELCGKIERANCAADVVELLVDWANDRSGSGSWSLTIMEHARVAPKGAASLKRQEEILSGHWRQLGECLLQQFPGIADDPETLGALLHEIAYAPAMTFVAWPTAGELMRLAMTPLLAKAAPPD
ncbi:TetR/AcrR family transcriptional regulator [Phytohalomonas tamaricis]|uniref:TetR/AcrR family transcriptional regulator n=1 Tax=Phytohalomonas tamaricis TaxID=2081032 RepID=UPI000D0BCFB7|nr:TetR/AcrR family transcriptional regulator [Phytohalomonas tamaricis]